MIIHSKKMLLHKKLNIKEVGWTEVCQNVPYNEYVKIEYNPNYEGYFLISYDYNLYFSKDLISWQTDYTTNYFADESDGYYYKITKSAKNDVIEIYISKMTSWKQFDNEILIDKFNKNFYEYFNFYGSAKLGNENIILYSICTEKNNNKTYTYDTFQKIASTVNFTEWNVKTMYSETDTKTIGNYQQTMLGSSGSKCVTLSERENGYCPVTFLTSEDYVIGAPVWTGGNMTSAKGFYCNGIWYYYSYSVYKSNDGINFSAVSNKYINPNMIFYNSCYITNNKENGLLRVYDKDFSAFTQISIPCEKVKNVLGIIENKLYILSINNTLYCTDIENLI